MENKLVTVPPGKCLIVKDLNDHSATARREQLGPGHYLFRDNGTYLVIVKVIIDGKRKKLPGKTRWGLTWAGLQAQGYAQEEP